MSLAAFSSPPRCHPEDDLHPSERLAVKLSSCFSSLRPREVRDSVARALEDIGTTFNVDECTLIAYGEQGSAQVVHSWAAQPHAPCTSQDLVDMPWLVQRLARNTVAVLASAGDIPHAAEKDRAHAERCGVVARLGVPIAAGTRVLYALVVGSRHRGTEWRDPVIERLQLLGEILCSGLTRLARQEVADDGARDAEPLSMPSALIEGDDKTLTPTDTSIIGDSAPLRVALSRLRQVAPLDTTVLLLGETGTGKELFAQALHDRSRRRRNRLIRVNCAALPATLIESELFGHERGAFTGALTMRQGRFELADGGTIFLDEIGDLAPDLQAKLLRVLQEGEFERLGSSKTHRVDVRVITATHVDLERAVAEEKFRADLYYRLSVFPIPLPPLRERPEDIQALVWFFIRRHERELGRRIARIPDAVMHELERREWPGNVRELENVIARAMIRSTDGTLELDDPPSPSGNGRHAAGASTPASPSPPAESAETLDAVQRSHIERVLRECGWRINGAGNAAMRLGMHPNTLRFRIKKLGLVIPDRRSAQAAVNRDPS
jgi:transcriptional regulator with GAF, ATPase, and Fis domain